MEVAGFTLPSLGLLLLTTYILLIAQDGRWLVVGLFLQYLAVSVLVAGVWPLEMAAVKLVGGWMTTAILATAMFENPPGGERRRGLMGGVFRLIAGGMVLLLAFSTAPRMVAFVPGVSLQQAIGVMLLMGMGLLKLGLSVTPLEVVLSLLVVLSGFEVVYAVVEDSRMVAGLLAGISLMLGLLGAYLHTVFSQKAGRENP